MAQIDHLLDLAREHVEDICMNKQLLACLPDNIITEFSQELCLDAILDLFNLHQDKLSIRLHQVIIAVEAWLRNAGLSRAVCPNESMVEQIKQVAINAIIPTRLLPQLILRPSHQSTNNKADNIVDASPSDRVRLRSMNLAGLHLLSHLERICPAYDRKSMLSLLSCVISFLEPQEAWSSPEIAELANAFIGRTLDDIECRQQKIQFAIIGLLEDHVKPQFAMSKSSALTGQGRKAIYPATDNQTYSDDEAQIKPWKFDHVYIVTVLQWIMENLDAVLIEAHWPLLIPPLLALIDDSTTRLKVRGCKFLTLFLKTAPPSLLQRTGLGEVFREALMPCLLCLPSLLMENESMEILEGAYVAMILLNQVQFPGEKNRTERITSFEKVLIDGIFKGYAYAGGNVKIAELLIQKMIGLVKELGIEVVKYSKVLPCHQTPLGIANSSLKHMLPLLSEILSAPFATAYPPLLQASLQAIQVLVVIIWPRVKYHRSELLEGLAICWLSIEDEATQSEYLQIIQANIKLTVKLVTSILRDDSNVVESYRKLIDCDNRLQNLLETP